MEPVSLVGRKQLIETIAADFSGPRTGGALVLGHAGYGKTSLAAGVVVALGKRVETVAVSASSTLSNVPFGALAPLLPSLPLADVQNPFAVLRELRALLQDDSAKHSATPLIVVDNAHALDDHSLAVLAQVATAELAHLLILARPAAGASQGLLSLWRDGYLTRYELPLLTAQEVHELCVQVLGGDIVRSATRMFAEESGGNPTLLLALIEHEQRTRHLTERNGVWMLVGERPAPDAQVIDTVRWQTIGDAAEEAVLETVSLAEPIPLPVLLELSTPEAVDRLEARRVISVSSDEQRLVHPVYPLYGEVIRHSVPLGRSISIRRRVLQHFDADPLSDGDLIRSVNWALDCGAAVPAERLLRAAVLANRSFDTPSALRSATAIDDPSLSVAAAVQAARAHFHRGETTRAQRLLDGAVKGASDLSTVAAATLLRAQVLLSQGAAADELHHAVADWTRAVRRTETATSAGPPAAEGMAASEAALSRLGSELLTLHANHLAGAFHGSESELHRIIDHPDGNDEIRMVALSMLGEVLESTGRPESASADTEESLHALQTHGRCFLPYSEFVITRHVTALISSGRWDNTRDALITHLDSRPGSLQHVGGVFHVSTGWALLQQGLMRSALRHLRVAIEMLREADVDQLLPMALGLGAYAAALSGELTSATEYGDDFLEVSSRSSAHRWTIGAAHVAAARLAVTGLTAHGAELQRLATSARERNLKSAQLVVLQLLLSTGDTSRLDELIDLCADNEGPAAAVLHAMALALRTEDGNELLAASTKAADHGYLLISAECAACAVRAYEEESAASHLKSRARCRLGELKARLEGVTSYWLDTHTDNHLLTRRQKEIAALAIEGLSNQRIAEQLNISHRTAEGHLYQMFMKLGISHREELSGTF